MRTIKIYGTGSATANAVAQVTIPSKTRLRGVQWAVGVDVVADSTRIALEVSRASASELSVNGAQQGCGTVQAVNNITTSGNAFSGFNQFQPADIPLDQGQILYLHALISGTATYYAEIVLWLD